MKGLSTEEVKDKANSRFETDTEKMTKWRGLSQEEMDGSMLEEVDGTN